MARMCFICGKGPRIGFFVSHAHNRVKRWIYPNVHKIRFTMTSKADNKVYSEKVCTKCVKAQKVQKVV